MGDRILLSNDIHFLLSLLGHRLREHELKPDVLVLDMMPDASGIYALPPSPARAQTPTPPIPILVIISDLGAIETPEPTLPGIELLGRKTGPRTRLAEPIPAAQKASLMGLRRWDDRGGRARKDYPRRKI